MPRKRHHKPLLLTEDERRTLEQWARRPKTAQRVALRARIVLACADSLPNHTVAARVSASATCVCKWPERFRVRRLLGLTDEPRPGAPRTATDDQIIDVITRTLEGPPAQATHWTTRGLAEVAGLSKSTIATGGLQHPEPRELRRAGQHPGTERSRGERGRRSSRDAGSTAIHRQTTPPVGFRRRAPAGSSGRSRPRGRFNWGCGSRSEQ